MSIVLYWHPMSSATPIAYALAELGIPHERVKIDIRAGEQHTPQFRALNPNGKVPTLTVNGAPLFEALAIHLWLGHTYGVARGLWPQPGTPQALQALSWSTWAYVSYCALLPRLEVSDGSEPATPDTERAQVLDSLSTLLAVLDGHLQAAPWMLGQDYSLVDLVVSAVIGYSAHLGAPVAAHPRVQAWLERVQARPAMQIDA
ncbi:glutathione S-transferase family protein [Pulveribacter sp.]|uniref:glutathione S-transferase family protein n=1 Tax=Pulveribacter sp. TaxID=2678893 RepID=UPI0028B060CF|nr:glutathione S-transferase family protein [Pulveribacter sp.]